MVLYNYITISFLLAEKYMVSNRPSAANVNELLDKFNDCLDVLFIWLTRIA